MICRMILLFILLLIVSTRSQDFTNPGYIAKSWINGFFDIFSPPTPISPQTQPPVFDLKSVSHHIFGTTDPPQSPWNHKSAINTVDGVITKPNDQGNGTVNLPTFETSSNALFPPLHSTFGDDPPPQLPPQTNYSFANYSVTINGQNISSSAENETDLLPELPEKPADLAREYVPESLPNNPQQQIVADNGLLQSVPFSNVGPGIFGGGSQPLLKNLPPFSVLEQLPPPNQGFGVIPPGIIPPIPDFGNFPGRAAVLKPNIPSVASSVYNPFSSPFSVDKLQPFLAPLVHHLGTAIEQEEMKRQLLLQTPPPGFGTLLGEDLSLAVVSTGGKLARKSQPSKSLGFGSAVVQDLRQATQPPRNERTHQVNRGFGSAVLEDLARKTSQSRQNNQPTRVSDVQGPIIPRHLQIPAFLLGPKPTISPPPQNPFGPVDNFNSQNALIPVRHTNRQSNTKFIPGTGLPRPEINIKLVRQSPSRDSKVVRSKEGVTHGTTASPATAGTPVPDPKRLSCGCIPLKLEGLTGQWTQVAGNAKSLQRLYTRMMYHAVKREMMPKCIGFHIANPVLTKKGYLESDLIWFHQDRMYGRKDEHRGRAIKKDGNLNLQVDGFKVPLCALKSAHDVQRRYTYVILTEANGQDKCRAIHVWTRNEDPGISIKKYLQDAMLKDKVEADLISLQRSCRRP